MHSTLYTHTTQKGHRKSMTDFKSRWLQILAIDDDMTEHTYKALQKFYKALQRFISVYFMYMLYY